MARDIVIVGAGIAGLACANRLAAAGRAPLVLEKSGGLGGRCATRRVRTQPVDHGLAFFHGSDEGFLEALRAAGRDDCVEGWPARVEGRGSPCQPRAFREGERRMAFRGGATTFAKYVAGDLDVRRRHEVARIDTATGGVTLTLDGGERFETQDLILALPAPQALRLLRKPAEEHPELRGAAGLLSMFGSERCLTLIAGYERPGTCPPWDMDYPETTTAVQLISHDSAKRDRPRATVLVIQGRACWSSRNWDTPAERWTAELLSEAASEAGEWAVRPDWVETHRWRFGRSMGSDELCRPLMIDLPGGCRLGVAGEILARGGGVQGAWRSGTALAARFLGENE